MIDSKDTPPKAPPFDPVEDDAIIDLVDEIEEGAPASTISALEQQLLGIPGAAGRQPAQGAPAADALDLSGIRFDEDDEALTAAPTIDGTARGAGGSMSLQDAQRALARDTGPGARRPSAGGANGIEEITEFEEQFLEAEDILDAKPSGQGEPPELLELDEADLDNELLLFDDLLKGDAPEAATPAGETEPEEIELLLPEDADLGPTSAADVFAAHLDSVFAGDSGISPRPAEGGIAVPIPAADPGPVPPPRTSSPLAGIVAAVAAAAPAAGVEIPAQSPPQAAPQPARLAPEEIEAAVERVIERKLGGRIEAAIRQAIETAVSREIERLKRLLLEDETP
ncbi:MAG TPA: hypothetical protein VLH81_03755 [Desulfobacterales bacterium]|nr:hypothetical protein [Desulfobacterales bacterium]